MKPSCRRPWTCLLAGVLFCWLGTVPGFARDHKQVIRATWDLDGDHKPDSAVGTVSGTTFKLLIQLSSQRYHIALKADVSREIAVRLFVVDVDGDNHNDLVLTGLSLRPIAVWLNRGGGKFQKATRWLYPPLYDGTEEQFTRWFPHGHSEDAVGTTQRTEVAFDDWSMPTPIAASDRLTATAYHPVALPSSLGFPPRAPPIA
jgi:hypothetical protein